MYEYLNKIFMKPKFLLLAAVLLTMLYSCANDPAEGTGEPQTITVNEAQVVQGMIRIKFDAEAGEAIAANLASAGTRAFSGISPLESLHDNLNIISIKRTFPYAGRFEERTRKAGMHLWYDVYFEEGVTVTRAANEFNGLKGVVIVEPQPVISLLDYSIMPQTMEVIQAMTDPRPVADEVYPFDDPRLPAQWHYYNDGSVVNSKAGADINVIEVWKTQWGHPDVIVAIVDGGLDYNHPDLQANYWLNTAELNGAAGVDDDGNGYVDDVYGWNFVDGNNQIIPHDHGTHVGGTVGAVNNNGIGVAGIAGGNGTPNSGVKLISCQVFVADPSAPNGNRSASDIGAAIKYGADNGAVISQNSWTSRGGMTNSVRDAIDYFIENAGIDENGNQEGPMKGGIVIFGAANDNTSTKYYPAAYDKVIAVAAMGVDYKKARYSNYGNWIDITAPGGDVGDPNQGNYSIKKAIFSTLPNNKYGYMQGTSMACPHVSGIAALMVSQHGVGKPGYTPDQLRERLLASVEDIEQYNPNYVGRLGSGYVNTYKTIFEGTGVPPQKITDLTGTWSADKVDLKWTVPADEDDGMPVHFNLYLSTSPITGGTSPAATLNVPSSGKVGDEMNYTFENLDKVTQYYVGVAGVDVSGNVAEVATIQGTTLSNTPPAVIKDFEDIYLSDMNSSTTLDLTKYFQDPDQDALTYNVTMSAPGVVTAKAEGNNLVITPAATKGSVDITLTATDPMGESVSATFNVFVRDGSKPMDLYPNPVSDRLNIQMGPEIDGTANVKLYNSTGMLAYNGDVAIKPRQAGFISVGSLAPGAYTVAVTYNGITYKGRIVKI